MKTDIKIDETTLPKNMEQVRWVTCSGVERSGVYISSEHAFAYVYNFPIHGMSEWNLPNDVDHWWVDEVKCEECDWIGFHDELHMHTQVDLKCPECGSLKITETDSVVETNGQAFNFDDTPPCNMKVDLKEAAENHSNKFKTYVSSEGLENIVSDFKAGAEWMLNKTVEVNYLIDVFEKKLSQLKKEREKAILNSDYEIVLGIRINDITELMSEIT